jgi:hypothetical protein
MKQITVNLFYIYIKYQHSISYMIYLKIQTVRIIISLQKFQMANFIFKLPDTN